MTGERFFVYRRKNIMNRFLDQNHLRKLDVNGEIHFLVEKVKQSLGDLDMRLRGDYFNLYYKGNSIAKVKFARDRYNVSVHKKFAKNIFDKEKRLRQIKRGEYLYFLKLDYKELRILLQTKYLNKIKSNIKKINYSEELIFEHMLITDNFNNNNLIIIDRQITETSLAGQRMDLLALRKIKDNKFGFLIIEIKLGNNKDLDGKVGIQLNKYLEHLNDDKNFENWKTCYTEVYSQMKKLALIHGPDGQIEIIKNIDGPIVVGGYSQQADDRINKFQEKFKDIEIRKLINKI